MSISYVAELPLCPPENHLHYSGNLRRYATAQYRQWLTVAAPMVRAALPAGWQPDTEQWWRVTIYLRLGMRYGDAPNYVKALLDSLSGAHVGESGRIEKPGALWDDDKRVALLELELAAVGEEEPSVTVCAEPAPAPPHRKRERLAAEKAERARLRAEAREAKAKRPEGPRGLRVEDPG